ncbi:MAG TPA: hypothetical protein VGR47_12425 [Terracidiphilus sp.]|nr:hypothetical protein [Terracidiphilus sp.]
MKISWSKAGFFELIAEFRQRPFLAFAGTAVGVTCGLFTTWQDQISRERTSVLHKVPFHVFQNPIVFGLIGIAMLVFVMGTIKVERERMGAAVFLFSFFGGAILAHLAIGIGRAVAASTLW